MRRCKKRKEVLARKSEEPTIEDGFGGCWSMRCPVCKELSMEIVRPGSAQCGNRGCSQWKNEEEE